MAGNIIQEKSYRFAIDVINFVRKFPNSQEHKILGNQLFRSGTSVGANVEEGIAAISKKDFINKMSIALKEARESHYWLRLIRDTRLSNQGALNQLINACGELIRILTSIVKTSQSKQESNYKC